MKSKIEIKRLKPLVQRQEYFESSAVLVHIAIQELNEKKKKQTIVILTKLRDELNYMQNHYILTKKPEE